ncbi:ribonuclease activity regulator RraA [Pelagovum pacificum]|uniref:Putative 4-hydroxy-4-methyl-2-oxoglutarate aldolase n=1 Tax=Pelagovum pacificum TaxID=2588711 RepID=A0A5C5GGK6_9RHOB|nr:ribonuclease activity regulator RraA [Pelagovum pacificum]QQA43520.1 ribonuclease activity regulator RraA [Pelagovum pacificum]TNY33344.1 ribonuclease activity regulator RraA [Pelagovum pacificum]
MTRIPTEIAKIERPSRALCDRLAEIGSATASSELNRVFGIRSVHIEGPQALVRGRKAVAGPALTLQFMPKREDLFKGGEYDNPELQLHRHVMYPAEAGDMIVVDACGDMSSGIFGEMMLTFFAGRGGLGVVVDGCIRDSGPARDIDVGIWVKGTTPNYHAQTSIVPWAVNVPVQCGGVLVMPGDIIVADDDGAIVVPAGLGEQLADVAGEHAEWEEFSRLRLSQGADLAKYYPLTDEVQDEYLAWKSAQEDGSGS